jgi:hypothetical protein
MAETTTYYRTAYGSHRHSSWYCANARRDITSGDPTVIPADEVSGWAACEHCCPVDEVRQSAEALRAKADALCSNSGVTHPKRINSACKDCGKTGKVQRGTGKLRAHNPQN